jgi:carboxyl-terminal processing protease
MMRYVPIKWLLSLLLFSGVLAAQPVGIELFDFATRVLQDEYINPRQLDINKIVDQYRDQLLKKCPVVTECAFSDAENIVKAMLASFDDSHLAFLGSNDYSQTTLGDAVNTGRYGFWVRATSQTLVVSDVYTGSPATAAGMKPGDAVFSVNDMTASPATLEKKLRELELSFAEANVKLMRDGQPYSVRIRPTYSSTLNPLLDDLGNGIVRIRIYELGILVQDQLIHDLIRQANNLGAKSLILDLRYNEGGSSLTSLKVAASFLQNPGEISISKDGSRFAFQYNNGVIEWRDLNDATNKGAFEGRLRNRATFDGGVVVLTTRKTFSAGEHLAFLLQSAKRGLVVGEASAGGLDTSAEYKQFKDLGKMYYGTTRYQTLEGKWLPPRVTPDVSITDFARGQDDILREAIKRLTPSSKP